MFKIFILLSCFVALFACANRDAVKEPSQALTVAGKPLVTQVIGSFHCDSIRDSLCVDIWNRAVETYYTCRLGCEQDCMSSPIPRDPNCDTGGQFPEPLGCNDPIPGSIQHRDFCISQCEAVCGPQPNSLDETCPLQSIESECGDCIEDSVSSYKVCQIPNIRPGRPGGDFFPQVFPCEKSFEGTSIECSFCKPSITSLGPKFGKQQCSCPTNEMTWSFSCRIPTEIPKIAPD